MLLEQNYRSTQNILSAANAVIANNFDRKDKKLWTDVGAGDPIIGFTGYSQHDEAQFVADEIEALHKKGLPYSGVAVFYRTNSQSRALEEIFIRSAVPYKIMGGTKFYERAEIKDALAYLIAVANPADSMALRRILNRPRRGIGDVTETAIARYAAEHGITFRDALANSAQIGVGPKLQKAIDQLDAVLSEATAVMLPASGELAPSTSVTEGLTLLLNKSGYFDALRASKDPQDEARLENLDELVAVTREFARNNPEGTIIDFLTEVTLVADADDLDDASGSVSLMTLHTAKGLEYDAVFLTGVEEDLLPHRISANEPGGPQEERRLFYVGITRARKRLHVSLAMTRAQFGEVTVAMPSRFLQEIPADLIDWRQSPGDVNGRGGSQSRALNARGRRPGHPGRGQPLRRRPRAAAEARAGGSEQVPQPHPGQGARQRRHGARLRRPHPPRRLRRGPRRCRDRRRREARRARAVRLGRAEEAAHQDRADRQALTAGLPRLGRIPAFGADSGVRGVKYPPRTAESAPNTCDRTLEAVAALRRLGAPRLGRILPFGA